MTEDSHFHEVRRGMVQELYRNSPSTADEISRNSSLPLSTVYKQLRDMKNILDVTGTVKMAENSTVPRKVKLYALKRKYSDGIRMCEDSGIDILDIVYFTEK